MTRTRAKSPTPKPKPEPVVVTRRTIRLLVPEARAEALRLAGGDIGRIEVVSPREAIVR